MKIAIASDKNNNNASVSSQAGRAPYFLIVEGGVVSESVKNPFAVGGGGAGISVAKMLSDMGVKKFIAQSVGANMREALDQRGIELVENGGSVSDYLGA